MHREVIMSAPIHMVHSPFRRDKDVGPVHLVYAPRGAREQTQQVSTLPSAPQIELLARGFSGDRGMLERQHALMGRIVLLLLIWSVAGVAVAAGVWAKTWMPDARAPLSVSLGNDDRWLAPVATRPEQPNQQVDVAARAMPEPKTTQEPANSPDRSEPASLDSAAATMTQPPLAQVPVPAPAVATRELPPRQTVSDLVQQRRVAEQRAIFADQRVMRELKSTPEPANLPDRSEPASLSFTAATMTQPPPAQGPVPAAAAATRELPPQQTVLDFVTRHLDADELALMLRRADDLIKSGDFSSARLLLTRVAEAGDAHAALTLAGTFDPDALRAAGMQGGAPDIALARLWYERAAQLGAADAPRRLRELATASAR
jgi:hypothetical protein